MRTFGNRLRAIVVILAGIALILGTSACSWFDSRQTNEPTPNGSTTPASKITVVATLNQWGSLAKQIGGNQVEVSSILSPDTTNAHSFDPNAKQVTQMRKAQVLLTNGAGYDAWADRSLPGALHGCPWPTRWVHWMATTRTCGSRVTPDRPWPRN